MKNKLTKIIIKTTLISSIMTFFLVVILQIFNSDRHITNCYMPLFTEILSLFFVWFLSFLLLPIFFNLYEIVRKSLFLSLISFYGLLITFTIFAVCDKLLEFNENPIYLITINRRT